MVHLVAQVALQAQCRRGSSYVTTRAVFHRTRFLIGKCLIGKCLLLGRWIGGLPERLGTGLEPQGQIESVTVRSVRLPIPSKVLPLRKRPSEATLKFIEFGVAASQGSFHGFGRFGKGERVVLNRGLLIRAFRVAHIGSEGLYAADDD